MTELTCWPLDNKQYTAVALGAAYAARSRGLLTAESFSLTTNGDNTVTLAKGLGCLHVSEFWACFPYSTNDIIVQFEDADGVYPRKDVVVLGYDKNANQAGIYVRTGLAASSPVMPTIRRDNDYDEIYLYCVNRPTGATSITADNVEDLRLDDSYCGLMKDSLDAVDTSVMQASFEALLAQIEQELDQLNAGTATMLKATYDPQGKNQDIFSYDAHLYKTIFYASGWSSSLPYTQRQGLTKMDGGPDVTASSVICSAPMSRQTTDESTNKAFQRGLAYINAGWLVLGNGTLEAHVFDKPTADVEIYILVRKG